MEILRNGRRFSVTDDHHEFWNAFRSGRWEAETLEVFDQFVQGNTTVLDIGAWIGPTTLYSAQRAKRVIALEPDPVAYEFLRANLALNPNISNVTLRKAAIAPQDGVLRLGVSDAPGDSKSKVVSGDDQAGWEVEAITPRHLWESENIDGPTFVKLDIEGFEYSVLPQIVAAFSETPTVFHISLHPHIFNAEVRRKYSEMSGIFGQLGRWLAPIEWRLRSVAAHAKLIRPLLQKGGSLRNEDGTELRPIAGFRQLITRGSLNAGKSLVYLNDRHADV